MRASLEEVTDLVKKWKESKVWIYVVFSSFSGDEQHAFWGRVEHVLRGEFALSGESALVSLPLSAEAEFEYLEPSEAPEHLRARFSRFEFILSIRSSKVWAFLAGHASSMD